MNLSAWSYLGVGTMLMLCCWCIGTLGLPASTRTEIVPTSVRENPASFRPSYSLWTGWHPAPAPSSGGGFGFGK